MKKEQTKDQYTPPMVEELRFEGEGIMQVSPVYNSPFSEKQDW